MGLLVQLAGSGASRWWYEPERRRPYFTTTLNQFVTALALEPEPLVAATILRGLQQLAPLSPYTVIDAIHKINSTFQSDLVFALAAYCACDGDGSPESRTQLIDRIATATPYYADVLQNLIKRMESPIPLPFAGLSRPPSFAGLVDGERLRLASVTEEDRALHRQETVSKISIAARRLNESADILAGALHLVRPRVALRMYVDYRGERTATRNPARGYMLKPIVLHGAFLVDAYLANLDLSNVVLYGAQLDGANLSGSYLALTPLLHASLERANLQRAYLGWFSTDVSLDNAYLFGAAVYGDFGEESNSWCAADFSSETGAIDQRLLVALCGRDVFDRIQELGGDAMTFLRARTGSAELKVHSTVQEFLVGKVFDDRDEPAEPLDFTDAVTIPGIVPSWMLLSGFFVLVLATVFLRPSHREDVAFFATVALGCVLLTGWWRAATPHIWRACSLALIGGGRGRIRRSIRMLLDRWARLQEHEVGQPMSRIMLSVVVGLALVFWQGARYVANLQIANLTLASLGLCFVLDAIISMRDRAKRTRYPLWK